MADNKQSDLLAIVETWRPNEFPEHRGFRCASCQQYINEAWYHWLNTGGYILPVHLCRICEQKFQSGTLQISQKKKIPIERMLFGNNYQFSQRALERFREIVKSWPVNQPPKLKAFTCDDCQGKLEFHTLPEGIKQRQGFHVWWKMPENKTLVELHFHRSCGNKLGISSQEENLQPKILNTPDPYL